MSGEEIVRSLNASLSLLKEYNPQDLAEINIVKKAIYLETRVLKDKKVRGKFWDNESTGHFPFKEDSGLHLVWFYRFGVWSGYVEPGKKGKEKKFKTGVTAEVMLRKLMPSK